MICPNCNATDHESGAKFCHKCGSPLVNGSSRELPKPQGRYNSSSAPIGVEAVDLGLPSGTKWANMNVGATRPEEFGGYFAWGETEEKDYYDWGTYTHCDGDKESCYDLGSDIAGTRYDVAHVKWGGSWVMPSYDQIQELLDNCTKEWTTFNGVNGRKFTSKANGASIFLPAAGCRDDVGLDGAGSYGDYLSSTQYPFGLNYVYFLLFGSDYAGWSDYDRELGRNVRPVSK